jgi:hypothetical protein
VHRRTYADRAESTIEAAVDLLDLDEDFHLVRHVRAGEDVVRVPPRRRQDRPARFSRERATDANDIVVPEESRYVTPLRLEAGRAEIDERNHRFLFFVDAADGRGKVLYVRHDGDYGLLERE